LDKPADKALTLYRMAQTEQRLGRWSQADQTFGTVQEQAAGSPLAAAAHALEGSRGFYVQVAKTANAHDAQSVITDLRQHGLTAQAVRDPNGASFDYVRVGPLTEYAQAQNLKARLASLYPQALIVP
jgi:cell division septation protein DedD